LQSPCALIRENGGDIRWSGKCENWRREHVNRWSYCK